MAASLAISPFISNAFCFAEAAQRYAIEPGLLQAIAYQESSFKPATVVHNANGTLDIGLMGINSVHLPELNRMGITREMLFDPCQNVLVGAFLLKKQIVKLGYTWTAVGAYHSMTKELNHDYQLRVYARWLDLQRNAANQQIAATN